MRQMRRRPSSLLKIVIAAWQLAPATVGVFGADSSTTISDQVCHFALETDGLDYDKLMADTAMLSAVRTNIAKAVAAEVGKGVAVDDVETALSKGTSVDGSGVGSVLAEVVISPPGGIRPEDIRDTLTNSSMLGDRVASGIESVSQGSIGTKAAGGSTVKVRPFTVPFLRDRDPGLNFVMAASLAAGILAVLSALLVYKCTGSHTFSTARTRFFGTTEEEDSRARRANVLFCCATKKEHNHANTSGWSRRSRAW
mmetsp:Transcript_6006/g.16151  ORF Transcript_6006/g.16151 Transcript_6006/m.16151 type:complete len:254 (+) Transcript_6006:101-862(+)